jgi:lipopolysaccharide transport system ATP-binding protein
MSSRPAISVNHIAKVYKLGLTGRKDSFPTIIRDRIRHPIHGNGQKRELFRALDDVTFDVTTGEVVGVIGKNGAGKSTLLKILSRITPPSEGYVDMGGTVGSLLEVGVGFHQELTGIENVYLNGTILGMSRREIDGRLDEIVDFAEVHKFLETPVKRYSSGMRVRLAFAVAAHFDPEILIIDEVLSVGDYAFQAKCLEKMKSIAAEQGRTVLYVSHNLVTVEHLCPRALLLVDGRLAFDGPTEQTMSKYLNLFPHAERGLTPGVFDLAAADRSGGDYAAELFKRLELRPNGGAPSDSVRMGERLRIEIAVAGFDAVPDAHVTVTVGSSSSQCLFRLSSRMVPLRAAHARRRDETIVIDIPSLPLTPGDYHLAVGAHDLKDSTLLDEVHHAAEFSVVPADVLGYGYQFTAAKDGHFMVPWEWEVRPSSADRVTSPAG